MLGLLILQERHLSHCTHYSQTSHELLTAFSQFQLNCSGFSHVKASLLGAYWVWVEILDYTLQFRMHTLRKIYIPLHHMSLLAMTLVYIYELFISSSVLDCVVFFTARFFIACLSGIYWLFLQFLHFTQVTHHLFLWIKWSSAFRWVTGWSVLAFFH
jgi:hypothetical protein